MKGHVPTPEALADIIVEKLFSENPPEEGDTILYPGLGTGPFVSAVARYCNKHGYPEPEGVGIEQDPEHLEEARERHAERPVDIQQRDYLSEDVLKDFEPFDYIVGNPPYVAIEGLSEEEKTRYKNDFDTAVGRFDLYILFFERSLNLLAEDGRLSFITPEKFEYTDTAAPLRRLLASNHVEEIEHVPYDSFDGYLTYPTITTVENTEPGSTEIIHRDGSEETVELPSDGDSWASLVRPGEVQLEETGVTLGDVTERVSCGLATGADSLYVMDESEVPSQLTDWTHPTTSGRQLTANNGPDSDSVLLCPYDETGRLVPEDELGEFGEWAEKHREKLEDRSCVAKGKVWYSWHENPPMQDILQEKILFPDVVEEPEGAFYLEETGDVVPRHSVYYIIPETHVDIRELRDYLNSIEVAEWIKQNAQKAHNDYYRMQSKVLKDLPVPEEWGDTVQQTLV